jgi:hypothetical protein
MALAIMIVHIPRWIDRVLVVRRQGGLDQRMRPVRARVENADGGRIARRPPKPIGYPLLLALADAGLDDAEWKAISAILESFLVRRAVCNLGTKNYNRIFLGLTRALRKEGFSADKLKAALLMQGGESGVWPDDATFKEAWLHKPLYGPLNSPKLVHL